MSNNKARVALQLYTVRDEAARDYLGTLRKVAAMGYAGVELAGTGGLEAKDLKEALDDLGLQCAGSHIGLDEMEKDLPGVMEYNLTIGNPNIVVPWVAEGLRKDAATTQALAKRLNALGAALHEKGLTLSYHNHAFEWTRFGDRTILDIIYEETDPALVKGQPDVYWIVYAGADPAAWLEKHGSRCPLVHLKDMTAGDKPTFAEVGEGVIDFQAIFKASAGTTEWYIVEQDRCARPSLESAALSLRHLKEWGIA